MKGSELLVKCLENKGVRHIFGVPGEETLDVLKALASSRQITVVTTQHVQSAAFMANVYGRLSPSPGVCLAAPGPDAGSLATGLTAAFYDRVPLVAITGQARPSGGRKDSRQDITGNGQASWHRLRHRRLDGEAVWSAGARPAAAVWPYLCPGRHAFR